MSAERLQKFLARAGIASRRKAEELILAGRVRVEGRTVTELGTRVDPRRSRVEVDGRRVVSEDLVYLVLHKPRGVMCTMSDPEGRKTVAELVGGAGARVVPVGRLDFQTSGVLLFTNDGDFAAALAHPSKGVEKVYVVKVGGVVDDPKLDRFRQSIVIDGRPTKPAEVRRLRVEAGKTWLEITLREGRNRQVRRLGEAAGFVVMRLARMAYAGITAEGLRPGQSRPLTVDELKELKRVYGVPKSVRAATPALGDERRSKRPGVRHPAPPARPSRSASGGTQRGLRGSHPVGHRDARRSAEGTHSVGDRQARPSGSGVTKRGLRGSRSAQGAPSTGRAKPKTRRGR